jgi:hypothetical protein
VIWYSWFQNIFVQALFDVGLRIFDTIILIKLYLISNIDSNCMMFDLINFRIFCNRSHRFSRNEAIQKGINYIYLSNFSVQPFFNE